MGKTPRIKWRGGKGRAEREREREEGGEATAAWRRAPGRTRFSREKAEAGQRGRLRGERREERGEREPQHQGGHGEVARGHLVQQEVHLPPRVDVDDGLPAPPHVTSPPPSCRAETTVRPSRTVGGRGTARPGSSLDNAAGRREGAVARRKGPRIACISTREERGPSGRSGSRGGGCLGNGEGLVEVAQRLQLPVLSLHRDVELRRATAARPPAASHAPVPVSRAQCRDGEHGRRPAAPLSRGLDQARRIHADVGNTAVLDTALPPWGRGGRRAIGACGRRVVGSRAGGRPASARAREGGPPYLLDTLERELVLLHEDPAQSRAGLVRKSAPRRPGSSERAHSFLIVRRSSALPRTHRSVRALRAHRTGSRIKCLVISSTSVGIVAENRPTCTLEGRNLNTS